MSIEFKSLTFSVGFLDENSLKLLKNDVELLGSIDPPPKWDYVIDRLKELILSESREERREIEVKLVEDNVLPSLQLVGSARRLMGLFFGAFSDDSTQKDTPDDIVDDLKTLGCLETSKIRESFKGFLSAIKTQVPWYDAEKLVRSVSAGVLPSLRGIGTTAELRGVFKRELRMGEKADTVAEEACLDKNQPLTPVISVALSVDAGIPDRFCFQASPKEISWLIEELRFAIHKARVIEKTFSSQKLLKVDFDG